MGTDDKRAFAEVMALLCETYDKKISTATVEIYSRVLAEWPIEAIQAAAVSHLRDPKAGAFWPKPADLIRWMQPLAPAQLEVAEQAEIAWQRVLDAIGRIGPYQPLELDDPVALACVRALGGWKKLCEQTHAQLVWIRKEFLTSYEIYARTPADQLPASLPGIGQLKNRDRIRAGGGDGSSREVVCAKP